MYIMLSIEATVYADSNDKYSSIFKISKTKSWDYYQYLNIVLNIYRCLEFVTEGWLSTYNALKCRVPSLTQSAEVNVFSPMLDSLHRK